MSTTNGCKAPPSREHIIMTAAYYAAISGYYDTSEAAQKANLLTISVTDMANIGEMPPPGASHKFYIMVNQTGYMVTRYPNEDYRVEPHDQIEAQRQERELREAVLEMALWHMTGAEGSDYRPGKVSDEERERVIAELLAEEEEEEPEEADPVRHAVVGDMQPDIFIAPGLGGGPPPVALRQWSVQIGPYNACKVGFFGYDEDGNLFLVPVDAEEPDDYDEEE